MNNLRWLLLDITFQTIGTTVLVSTTSDVPCHMYLRWTDHKPYVHLRSESDRGLEKLADPDFCFVQWQEIEQNEPGDTLQHTFTFPAWSFCLKRWFYFRASINGIDSVSNTPIFLKHYAPPVFVFTPSMDGYLIVLLAYGQGLSWQTIRTLPESSAAIYDNSYLPIWVWAQPTAWPNLWRALSRITLLFDTSSIPDTYPIQRATLDLYGTDKYIANNPQFVLDLNVYTSNPQYDDKVVVTDFPRVGSNPLSFNFISYPLWKVGDWNTFEFKESCLKYINRTGLTKLAIRSAFHDAAGVTPTWSGGATAFIQWAGKAHYDSTKRPRLTVY